MMKFHKSLAKFYRKWLEDATASIKYCEERGNKRAADDYRQAAIGYKKILDENQEAVEFFSQGDNASKIDSALPEQFRGYK
jgi:hypothetical protein